MDDAAGRQAMVDFLKTLQLTSLVSWAELYNNPVVLSSMVRKVSADFCALATERWRIYCLTPHPDLTLMWSHYADNHRGICLEFSTENNDLFSNACKVSYRKEYPQWSLHTMDEYLEVFLTKSDDWKYEEEYRIIARAGATEAEMRGGGLITVSNDAFLSFPAAALVSVIAGSESNLAGIRATVARCAPGLPVKRAVRSPNGYRLQIEE
jgi:hypothetical protein